VKKRKRFGVLGKKRVRLEGHRRKGGLSGSRTKRQSPTISGAQGSASKKEAAKERPQGVS